MVGTTAETVQRYDRSSEWEYHRRMAQKILAKRTTKRFREQTTQASGDTVTTTTTTTEEIEITSSQENDDPNPCAPCAPSSKRQRVNQTPINVHHMSGNIFYLDLGKAGLNDQVISSLQNLTAPQSGVIPQHVPPSKQVPSAHHQHAPPKQVPNAQPMWRRHSSSVHPPSLKCSWPNCKSPATAHKCGGCHYPSCNKPSIKNAFMCNLHS
mmetsp:Transcript_7340/g.11167  ORF Transcript_7340/g.11167 Transcript_7340/m.11167 type:complete len:210 (-) Transcript_7340:832-1461(-)